jgi:hypothetical protein
MKTFREFLEIIQEKKNKLSKKERKRLSKGIVVKKPKPENDGTLTYNLGDSPKPIDTKPGSEERDAQIQAILDNGAKKFKN